MLHYGSQPMNQASVKASNREIRRAFGGKAMDTLTACEDTVSDLDVMVKTLRIQRDTDLEALQLLADTQKTHHTQIQELRAWAERSFWQRVREFLRGR